MLELLFKQLGFNPADLKKQVDNATEQFTAVINHFNSRMDYIQKQNSLLIKLHGGNEDDIKPITAALEKLPPQPLSKD